MSIIRAKLKAHLLTISGELNKGKSIDAEQLKEVDTGCGDMNNEKGDADTKQQGNDGEGNVKAEETIQKMGWDVEGKTTCDDSIDPAAADRKPTKKKVIKKVVKVVRKKPTTGASADKSSEDKNVVAQSASKTAEVGQNQPKNEDSGKDQVGAGISQQPEANKTGKKKIIRRIVKRKVSASSSQLTASATPVETSNQEAVQPEKNVETSTVVENPQTKLQEGSKAPSEDTSNQKKEEKPEEKEHPLTDHRSSNEDNDNHKEALEQKDIKKDGKKDKTKDDKEKNRDLKMDPKQKPLNDTKEKKKSDEPPKYPGFILQAKRNKESKVWVTCYIISFLFHIVLVFKHY